MFINNNWNKANIKYPLEILCRIIFLSLYIFVEIIVNKDPPKFVNPWNNPKNLREKFILIPLAIAVILIGILPNIFIDPMRLSLELILTNYEIANGK